MNPSTFLSRNAALFMLLTLMLAGLGCAMPAGVQQSAPAAPEEEVPSGIQPTQTTSQPSQPAESTVPPAIPETRRLTLEFPSKMRAGVESDVVRLTLEVDALGNITPTAQIEGNVVVGETIEIPDLYETHNVTAEARLDLAGMEVQPFESIYEPLKKGQSATFHWSIRPQETGLYRGTVWLHLNFVDKSTGETDRIAVSAQIIEIEAVDFFGLSVNVARTSGVVGSVIGGVIGFPFLEDILRFLFKRKSNKRR
ncbi:hypothetical protein ANAEL_00654 [Anaerolineales bacterium]|nr:hypothetical protein ANAEL_00654 [Anaerolineales bacterium]